jgi:hypothetical protein
LHPAELFGRRFNWGGFGDMEGDFRERIRRRQMSSVDLSPCFYHWNNLFWTEVGESEVMARREGEDETFSCYGICAQQKGGEV